MYPTNAAFSGNACSMKGKSGPKVEDSGLALFIARAQGTRCVKRCLDVPYYKRAWPTDWPR